MLLCITGLHASGKSYFCDNIISKYGYQRINKKEIVANICEKETGSKDDWQNWYKTEYNKNPFLTTLKIIKELPLEQDIVLDAVHSYKEWKIINSVIPQSMMIAITTPEDVRVSRHDVGDKEKDHKRIEYWHSDYNGEKGCLLSEVSWTFNGAAPDEVNEMCFQSLLDYINSKYENYTSKNKSLIREN